MLFKLSNTISLLVTNGLDKKSSHILQRMASGKVWMGGGGGPANQ